MKDWKRKARNACRLRRIMGPRSRAHLLYHGGGTGDLIHLVALSTQTFSQRPFRAWDTGHVKNSTYHHDKTFVLIMAACCSLCMAQYDGFSRKWSCIQLPRKSRKATLLLLVDIKQNRARGQCQKTSRGASTSRMLRILSRRNRETHGYDYFEGL